MNITASAPNRRRTDSTATSPSSIHKAVYRAELDGGDGSIDETGAILPLWNQDLDCGANVGCGDCVDAGACDCGGGNRWYAGFEATFLHPHFENNTAFSVMESNGISFQNLSDAEFDYGLEFSPRAFVGLEYSDGVGFQATWWQFDHDAAPASANPPANGFGEITHPPFGDVDISTTIPGDTFSAISGLDAYTIDLEVTESGAFSAWTLGVAGGVRYANIQQSYLARTTDSGDDLLGQIDYRHDMEGFGPTISLSGSAPLSQRIDLFCRGRGSLLFGTATSRLNAGEDLDLTTPFTTTKNTSRDDLLPIAELQLGLKWNGIKRGNLPWQPFATVAIEAQHWNGVGNATSDDGNLGFFGFAGSVGAAW